MGKEETQMHRQQGNIISLLTKFWGRGTPRQQGDVIIHVTKIKRATQAD
jgi:hypothetical protein